METKNLKKLITFHNIHGNGINALFDNVIIENNNLKFKNWISGQCKDVLIKRKRYITDLDRRSWHVIFSFSGDHVKQIKRTFKQFCDEEIKAFYFNDHTYIFLPDGHFFNSNPILLDFFVIVSRNVIKENSENGLGIDELVESLNNSWAGVSYKRPLVINSIRFFQKFVEEFTKEEHQKFLICGMVNLSNIFANLKTINELDRYGITTSNVQEIPAALKKFGKIIK
jgi:hypothetical protein